MAKIRKILRGLAFYAADASAAPVKTIPWKKIYISGS